MLRGEADHDGREQQDAEQAPELVPRQEDGAPERTEDADRLEHQRRDRERPHADPEHDVGRDEAAAPGPRRPGPWPRGARRTRRSRSAGPPPRPESRPATTSPSSSDIPNSRQRFPRVAAQASPIDSLRPTAAADVTCAIIPDTKSSPIDWSCAPTSREPNAAMQAHDLAVAEAVAGGVEAQAPGRAGDEPPTTTGSSHRDRRDQHGRAHGGPRVVADDPEGAVEDVAEDQRPERDRTRLVGREDRLARVRRGRVARRPGRADRSWQERPPTAARPTPGSGRADRSPVAGTRAEEPPDPTPVVAAGLPTRLSPSSGAAVPGGGRREAPSCQVPSSRA